MRVEQMSSSLFEELVQFPEGTCELDAALLMRNLPARWTPEPLGPDLGNSEGADSLEFTLRVRAQPALGNVPRRLHHGHSGSCESVSLTHLEP
jgi:hypothetical protein